VPFFKCTETIVGNRAFVLVTRGIEIARQLWRKGPRDLDLAAIFNLN